MFYLLETPLGIGLFKETENGPILLKKTLFKTESNAVSSLIALNDGTVPADILNLLKDECPKASTINILNPKICETVSKELNINTICSPDDTFRELRTNSFKYFEVSKNEYRIATSKLAYKMIETDRSDMILIDILSNIEELDVSINNRLMRIREWYSIHFPELDTVSDNLQYLNCLIAIGNRNEFLESTGSDSIFPVNIVELVKMSMGSDMKTDDILRIKEDANDIIKDISHKNNMLSLMKKRTQESFPNLYNLAGENLAIKLIKKAGSISELAQQTSSTIQIFGAEKAFNEAIKTGNGTPKYGFIFNHACICTSPDEIKGKVARMLANKIALCARVDSDIKKKSNGEFGLKMKEKVEKAIEKLLDKGKKDKKAVLNKKRKILSVKEYDASRDSKRSKID